jgi:hypothetical protein
VERVITLWNKIGSNQSLIDKLRATHQKSGSKMPFKIAAFQRMLLTLPVLQDQLFSMLLSDLSQIKCIKEAVGAAADKISKRSNLWNVFTTCHPDFDKISEDDFELLKSSVFDGKFDHVSLVEVKYSIVCLILQVEPLLQLICNCLDHPTGKHKSISNTVKKILEIDKTNAIHEKKVAFHLVEPDAPKKGGCPKNGMEAYVCYNFIRNVVQTNSRRYRCSKEMDFSNIYAQLESTGCCLIRNRYCFDALFEIKFASSRDLFKMIADDGKSASQWNMFF